MRDNLLHHGVEYDVDQGNLMWSNLRAAHVPDKLQEFFVSVEMINDLAIDTGQVVLGIAYEISKNSMPEEALEWFRENMSPVWRYKPPTQVAKLRDSSSNPHAPKRQRSEHKKGRFPKR